MTGRQATAAGIGCCLASLGLAFADPRGALAGWLVGFAFWSAVPVGALCLLMMMNVVPGSWREELRPWTERALAFLPLAAVAVVPVLLGERRLYGWDDLPSHGFRAAYLSAWSFPLRSMLFFVGMGLLMMLLQARPAIAVALSAGGLVGFVLFDTTMMVDWLMSLEPGFHSSGFGLYGLGIQTTIALAAIILLRLLSGGAGENNGVLGGLLITTLLIAIYLAFMQFFITWSDNLRDGVKWYQERGEGLWTVILYAAAVCHIVPLFLLFFPPVRQGRRWLISLSAVILLAKVLELAWLVLPVAPEVAVGVASAMLALVGIGFSALMLPPRPRRAVSP